MVLEHVRLPSIISSVNIQSLNKLHGVKCEKLVKYASLADAGNHWGGWCYGVKKLLK